MGGREKAAAGRRGREGWEGKTRAGSRVVRTGGPEGEGREGWEDEGSVVKTPRVAIFATPQERVLRALLVLVSDCVLSVR